MSAEISAAGRLIFKYEYIHWWVGLMNEGTWFINLILSFLLFCIIDEMNPKTYDVWYTYIILQVTWMHVYISCTNHLFLSKIILLMCYQFCLYYWLERKLLLGTCQYYIYASFMLLLYLDSMLALPSLFYSRIHKMCMLVGLLGHLHGIIKKAVTVHFTFPCGPSNTLCSRESQLLVVSNWG